MNRKNNLASVKKLRRVMIRLVPGIVFCVGWLSGCMLSPDGLGDTGGTENRPYQTRILAAYAVPDTVAPGDTARFICIIKDSINSRFKFLWYIDQGEVIGATYSNTYKGYISDSNIINWKAPLEEGFYAYTVYAYDGSKDSASVSKSFTIEVER